MSPFVCSSWLVAFDVSASWFWPADNAAWPFGAREGIERSMVGGVRQAGPRRTGHFSPSATKGVSETAILMPDTAKVLQSVLVQLVITPSPQLVPANPVRHTRKPARSLCFCWKYCHRNVKFHHSIEGYRTANLLVLCFVSFPFRSTYRTCIPWWRRPRAIWWSPLHLEERAM